MVIAGCNTDTVRCIGVCIGSYPEKVLREDFDTVSFSAKTLCNGGKRDVIITTYGTVVTGVISEYIPAKNTVYDISDDIRALAKMYYDYIQAKLGVIGYINQCQEKLHAFQSASNLTQSKTSMYKRLIDVSGACREVEHILTAMRENGVFFGYPTTRKRPAGRVVDMSVSPLVHGFGLQLHVTYPTIFSCDTIVFERAAGKRYYADKLVSIRDEICPLLTTVSERFTLNGAAVQVTAQDKIAPSLAGMQMTSLARGQKAICYMPMFTLTFSQASIPAQLLIDAMTYVCEVLATGDVRSF